jgi:hypothetical protein
MNDNHDKQDELQRMLALKRHETPPPRFFNGFSDKVIDRLDSPELLADQTWWQRLGLDSKPVLMCASGVAVCGLLVLGIIASLRVERPKPAPRALGDDSQFVVALPGNALAAPLPPALSSVTTEGLPRVGDAIVVSGKSPFGTIKLQPIPAALNTPPASNRTGGD